MAQIPNSDLFQSIITRKILEKGPACSSLASWRYKTWEVVCRHRRTERCCCLNSWEIRGIADAQCLTKYFSGVTIARQDNFTC